MVTRAWIFIVSVFNWLILGRGFVCYPIRGRRLTGIRLGFWALTSLSVVTQFLNMLQIYIIIFSTVNLYSKGPLALVGKFWGSFDFFHSIYILGCCFGSESEICRQNFVMLPTLKKSQKKQINRHPKIRIKLKKWELPQNLPTNGRGPLRVQIDCILPI